MATKKKLLQAAAGSAGGAGLNVEDVFSTYLYEGTGSSQTITNGIDLSGEGGAVWIKSRTSTAYHLLHDTERGATKTLYTNTNNAEITNANGLSAFTSSGFTVGTEGSWNGSGNDFASWTFRKAPKFFDVVTYTGNGTTNRQISHNLGSAPGCIIVKRTNGLKDWAVYHRGKGNTHYGTLNTTEAFYDAATWWQDTDPTSTNFTVGNSAFVNANGDTYVAYLFAHNDGDGEFGPDADADIIKCGSYTGDGGAGTTEVNLGFEPQWILVKASSATENWFVIDNMRGWATHNNTANDAYLSPNATNAESTGGFLDITSTGFKTTLYSNVNVSGRDYIYIAIRRGPMAVPESATDVFAIDTRDGSTLPTFTSGFPVDFHIYKTTATSSWRVFDRLRGANELQTASTAAEASNIGDRYTQDQMEGIGENTGTSSSEYQWMWRRAPNYFDVVAYTGDGVATQDINHNLGVSPEMIWVKRRDASGSQWPVWHSGNPNYSTYLNTNLGSYQTAGGLPNYVGQNVSSTTFRVSTDGSASQSNGSGATYIAYLFASLDGVSKVGSYTGNGTSQNIDCGFSSGARFVLIKPNRSGDAWYVWDSTRGIVSGNDPFLLLNTTDAEITGADYIDPYSGGFNVTGGLGTVNRSGIDHIFYAVA